MHNLAKPLHVYTDPLDIADCLKHLSREDLIHYNNLAIEYLKFAVYSNKLTYGILESIPSSYKEQIESIIQTAGKGLNEKVFYSYSHYFDHMEQRVIQGIKLFEDFLKLR